MKHFFPIVLVIFLLLLVPVTSATAEDYFVAPKGNDAASGTIQQPFQTIQHAINESQHGDTIFIRQGNYYELLSISSYRTSSNDFLTIQPYQNEQVVINGSKHQHTMRAGFTIEDSTNIKLHGLEISNITTNDENFYPAGILITGNSKDIRISNNTIHTIANSHEAGNAHGILVYGNNATPIENISISQNHLYNLSLGNSESLTVSGNVTNFLIDRNLLFNNNNIGIDIAGHYGACISVNCTDAARNGTVSNNHVSQHSSLNNSAYHGDNSAPGIYVDGGHHINILNNYVANNNFGISIGSENKHQETSHILVQSNTIKNNDKAGLVIGGSTQNHGGADQIMVKNNRFVANDTLHDGSFEITLQQNIKSLTLLHNTYTMCQFTPHIYNASTTKIPILVANETIQFSRALCLKENMFEL